MTQSPRRLSLPCDTVGASSRTDDRPRSCTTFWDATSQPPRYAYPGAIQSTILPPLQIRQEWLNQKGHFPCCTQNLQLSASQQYAIPSYQRNYVWTREGQWEPLWDDLRALTRQVLAEGPNARPHFLGTIITKHIGTQGFIDRWWVVDGQQRLTTLQILIAAARSAFDGQGFAQCVAVLTDALVNPPQVVREQQDKYKIEHKSSDYQGFSSIVEAGLAGTGGAGPSLPTSLRHRYPIELM